MKIKFYLLNMFNVVTVTNTQYKAQYWNETHMAQIFKSYEFKCIQTVWAIHSYEIHIFKILYK